jgi:hypothetical protein
MHSDTANTPHSSLPSWLSPETRGNQPLWRIFWIYGVACSHLLFVALLWLFNRVDSPLYALLLVGFVGYSLLITRLVWTNALNVRDEQRGVIARFLTVAWALNAILVSAFLLLSHLGGHALPLLGG